VDLARLVLCCGYIGTTVQAVKEAYRWLLDRGQGTPVLTWANGITRREAIDQLGFKIAVLYKDPMQLNVTAVEAALQRGVHDFGLPVRLHRVVGSGAWGYNQDSTIRREYTVFYTYSVKVQAFITRGGEVMVTSSSGEVREAAEAAKAAVGGGSGSGSGGWGGQGNQQPVAAAGTASGAAARRPRSQTTSSPRATPRPASSCLLGFCALLRT
jgi:hypothetical protein